MRKIFLTSGLVVCMACPAFAAYDISPTPNQGTNNYPLVNDPNNGIASCTEPTLGSYTGPTTFYAKWTSNFYEITLDPNTSANGAGNTSIHPTELWGVTGDGIYKTRTDNTTEGYDFTGKFNLTDAAAVFGGQGDSTPVGKTVTYTVNENWPAAYSNYTADQKSAWATNGTDASGTTVFDGFYLSTDTTHQTRLIDQNGNITQDGINRSNDIAASEEWVANYTCATPAPVLPSLRGYTPSWETTPTCITDSAQLNVNWTAHTGTITFTCGDTQGTSSFAQGHSTTGQSSNNTSNVQYDGSYEMANTAGNCQLPGYHFDGWSCDYDLQSGDSGTTTYALEGETVTNGVVTGGSITNGTGTYRVPGAGAAITCKVVWVKNNITLNWTDTEGGNTFDQTSCTYDEGITLPTAPSRAGYTFDGWSVTNPHPTGN